MIEQHRFTACTRADESRPYNIVCGLGAGASVESVCVVPASDSQPPGREAAGGPGTFNWMWLQREEVPILMLILEALADKALQCGGGREGPHPGPQARQKSAGWETPLGREAPGPPGCSLSPNVGGNSAIS